MNNKDNNNEEKIMANIKALAKEAPVEIYPQLFNVVGIEHGGQKILLYTKAHYTKEEAIEQFKIKATIKTGVPADKWVIKVITSISAGDLEQEFIDIRDQAKSEKKRAKNKLMQEIIQDKDVEKLQRNFKRFTDYEVRYMHDAIINPK